MLMQEPTEAMIIEWKSTFEKYRAKLFPNRKSGDELIEYLTQKYTVKEVTSDKWYEIVRGNVMDNDHNAKKLPEGKIPNPRVYLIENIGAGKSLYENQDKVFDNTKIVVGIELETAFFMVEGSSLLWDELFAYRGLDEADLDNVYLVAEYVSCLKRFGMLVRVIF